MSSREPLVIFSRKIASNFRNFMKNSGTACDGKTARPAWACLLFRNKLQILLNAWMCEPRPLKMDLSLARMESIVPAAKRREHSQVITSSETQGQLLGAGKFFFFARIFFRARLDFFPPPLNAPRSPRMRSFWNTRRREPMFSLIYPCEWGIL